MQNRESGVVLVDLDPQRADGPDCSQSVRGMQEPMYLHGAVVDRTQENRPVRNRLIPWDSYGATEPLLWRQEHDALYGLRRDLCHSAPFPLTLTLEG